MNNIRIKVYKKLLKKICDKYNGTRDFINVKTEDLELVLIFSAMYLLNFLFSFWMKNFGSDKTAKKIKETKEEIKQELKRIKNERRDESVRKVKNSNEMAADVQEMEKIIRSTTNNVKQCKHLK